MKWLSEMKRNEPSTHATVWINSNVSCLVKETRHKRLYTVLHLGNIMEKVGLYGEKKICDYQGGKDRKEDWLFMDSIREVFGV